MSRQGLYRNGLIADLTSASPMVHSYTTLFEQLSLAVAGANTPLIVVTSPARGDGRSTIAANMAICAAGLGGHRTLIVDADMGRPGLSKLFGVPKTDGLAEVLMGTAAWEDVVQSTGDSGPAVMTAGHGPSSVLVARASRFPELVEQWRSHYDWIVLDSSPVLLSAGACVAGRHASGALLAMRAGRTRPEVLEAAATRLRDTGVRILGAVLNRRRFMIPRFTYRRL